mmetsp:Transcript_55224/g.131642  ORF Transcript_55224/g.131642 Transcript_55224/m.131642 type:complete len:257 (+) Transcript_55224:304-1074(+)
METRALLCAGSEAMCGRLASQLLGVWRCWQEAGVVIHAISWLQSRKASSASPLWRSPGVGEEPTAGRLICGREESNNPFPFDDWRLMPQAWRMHDDVSQSNVREHHVLHPPISVLRSQFCKQRIASRSRVAKTSRIELCKLLLGEVRTENRGWHHRWTWCIVVQGDPDPHTAHVEEVRRKHAGFTFALIGVIVLWSDHFSWSTKVSEVTPKSDLFTGELSNNIPQVAEEIEVEQLIMRQVAIDGPWPYSRTSILVE